MAELLDVSEPEKLPFPKFQMGEDLPHILPEEYLARRSLDGWAVLQRQRVPLGAAEVVPNQIGCDLEQEVARVILALGLAIITGLVLSGATPKTAARRQGFSETGQSPSFVPETVRLRKTP